MIDELEGLKERLLVSLFLCDPPDGLGDRWDCDPLPLTAPFDAPFTVPFPLDRLERTGLSIDL